MNNIAFIDGQNLHLGTQESGWAIDHKRFRIYLKDKYKVETAYYFLGYIDEEHQGLYSSLQKAGFIIVFREHLASFAGKKKGNVDTDIVFEMMKYLLEGGFDKMLLVSGDGDYKRVVDYLIKKERFKKILFPNKKFRSSLYKQIPFSYYDFLEKIRKKIEYKKRAP